MADETELKGKSALLSKLAELVDSVDEYYDWTHKNEKLFGPYGKDLDKTEELFDKWNDDAREIRRETCNRLIQLGGRLEGMIDDPIKALNESLKRLSALRDLCQSVYKVTEGKDWDDYVTQDILTNIQETLEKRISKLEALLDWGKSVGDQLFKDYLN